MKFYYHFFLPFVLCFCFSPVFAQLARWELSGLNGTTPSPLNATSLGDHITSATLSRGPSLTATP